MKRTKTILSWLVGIIVGLYLMVTLLVNIPFVQRWLANGVEGILERVLNTEIEVGRIEIAWNGRLIVNDLQVWDKQGEEMLRVARVAARLGIRDLVNHRIRISNAQLFGMHANLYQECKECDPNFKFLIDALRVIEDEKVDIYLVNPKAPCFIRDKDSTYIYLVLPVNFTTVD